MASHTGDLAAVRRVLGTVDRDGQEMRRLTLTRSYPTTPGGPVGGAHRPRADPPLVPAGHGRPARRRPLPARGQRRRRRAVVRPAPDVLRHLGVRRPRELGDRDPHPGRHRHRARAGARRAVRPGSLGPLRPRRGRHRLGAGPDRPGRARRHPRAPSTRRRSPRGWRATTASRSWPGAAPAWAEARIAAGDDAEESRAAAARCTAAYTGPGVAGARVRRARRPGAAPDPGAARRGRAHLRRGGRGDRRRVRDQPAGGLHAPAGAPRERLRQHPGRGRAADLRAGRRARWRRSTPG